MSDYDPEFECQGCGKRASSDGADSLLGWAHDEDGELSFCPTCASGSMGDPPRDILNRFHARAARYADFKRLLYEHREDALTCYDHDGFYCCTCGEHMALGYQEHLAAVLAKREDTLVTAARRFRNAHTDAALAEVEMSQTTTATTLRPGDVVRYRPDDKTTDRFWCKEGTGIVREDGVVFDTYWNTDRGRLSATEVARAEVLFNLADYESVRDGQAWETYPPDDRRFVTSQHRLQIQFYVRKGSEPDLETKITNAQEELAEARRKVESAEWHVGACERDLAHLEAQRPAPSPSSPAGDETKGDRDV